MALSGNSSTNVVRSAGVSPYPPLTLALWMYIPNPIPLNGTDYFFLINLTDAGGVRYSFNPHIVPDRNNLRIQCGINVGNSSQQTYDYASSNSFYDPGQWLHYCATFADNGTPGNFGSAREYINGTYFPPAWTVTGQLTLVNNDALSGVSVQMGSVNGAYYIAYPAIWKSILTDAQVLSLAQGADPRTVGTNLVAFADLNNTSSCPDLVANGVTWNVTGTAALQTDPPITPITNPPPPPPPTNPGTYISTGMDTGGPDDGLSLYSAGRQSIQHIHDAAWCNNGDIILIPDGSYTWNSGVTITKAITLQAQNMPANAAVTPSNVYITHGGVATTLVTINMSSSSAGNPCLAGVNFLPGSAGGTCLYYFTGGDGVTYVPLMHDCTFNIPSYQIQQAGRWTSHGGVIWQCHWFGSTLNMGNGRAGGTMSGVMNIRSTIPWNNYHTMGTADVNGIDNLYIEDSRFDGCQAGMIDVDDNGRVVFRNNHAFNSMGLVHAVTSLIGGLHVEIYNNVFDSAYTLPQWSNTYGQIQTTTTSDPNGLVPNMYNYFWWRGGTGRIWGNTCTQLFIYSAGYGCWVFEDEDLTRQGTGSNGNWEYDSNYPGYHWCGQSGMNPRGTPFPTTANWQQYKNYQISNPVYLWNNTYVGTGAKAATNQVGTQDSPGTGTQRNPNPNVAGNTAPFYATQDVFLLNRDYFYSAPPANVGGVTGAYAAYTYPHPLRLPATVPSDLSDVYDSTTDIYDSSFTFNGPQKINLECGSSANAAANNKLVLRPFAPTGS